MHRTRPRWRGCTSPRSTRASSRRWGPASSTTSTGGRGRRQRGRPGPLPRVRLPNRGDAAGPPRHVLRGADVVVIAAVALALVATPAASELARRAGLLDHPGPLKVQTKPVPYLGGLAV